MVHKDTRIHTGGFVTMLIGVSYVQSSKQKLENKSSTETNLVGLYDVPTQVIWNRYFLKEQGYIIHDNIIYQDNKSAIKLENDGRQLSSKKTRHINIR